MTKVYPDSMTRSVTISSEWASSKHEVVLTVWKKSMLFNCDGFTVFDSNGNLVFRVDNYLAQGNGEIVLMDSPGRSLQTIRHRRLTHNWLVYDQETAVKPVLSVKKHVNLLNTKSLAYVINDKNGQKRNNIYEIEGSYAQNCCVVYDDMRRRVAEIRPKEAKGGVALGGDVFSLVVQPDFIDPVVAMSLVIVLDQMFRSTRRSLISKYQ